jgi:hypothetical protein
MGWLRSPVPVRGVSLLLLIWFTALVAVAEDPSVPSTPRPTVSFVLEKQPPKDALPAFGSLKDAVCRSHPWLESSTEPITLRVADMPVDVAIRWLGRLSGQKTDLAAVETRSYIAKDTGLSGAKLGELITKQLFASAFEDPKTKLECDGDTLTITQTGAMHEQIADLLDLLGKPVPASGVLVSARSEWRERAMEELTQKRVSIHFQRTPLREALVTLQKSTDLPLILGRTLVAEGKPAMPITLKLDDVSLPNALKWTARDAGLYCELFDHAMTFGSEDDWFERECRVYDIGAFENPFGLETGFSNFADRLKTWLFYELGLGEANTGSVAVGNRLIIVQRPGAQAGVTEFLSKLRQFLDDVHKVEPGGKPPAQPLPPDLVPYFGGKPVEEPWKSPLLAMLEKKITFSFQNMPVREALQFIQDECGINMAVDRKRPWDNENPLITLRAKDMKARLALRRILEQAELEYSLREEVLNVHLHVDITEAVFPIPYYGRDLESVIPVVELPAFVTSVVHPWSWNTPEHQFMGCSAENDNGILMVLQQPSTHTLLEEMFADLRVHHQEPFFFPDFGRSWRKETEDAYREPVSFRFIDTPLSEALDCIKEQTTIAWRFSDATLEKTEFLVTGHGENVEALRALNQILAPLRLRYEAYGAGIAISSQHAKDERRRCAIHNLSDFSDEKLAALRDELSKLIPAPERDAELDPPFFRFFGTRLVVQHTMDVQEAVVEKIRRVRKK